MIYAVDFDGTLVENIFPKIGAIRRHVFDFIKEKQAAGNTIILWTCREGEMLNEAVAFCKSNGLTFDLINENTDAVKKTYKGDSRKVIADYYIDDKSLLIPKKKEAGSMKETRSAEIRANAPAGTSNLIITGQPIIFDKPTIINSPAGQHTEIIRCGALDGADMSDCRLLYNHDTNRVPLARTPKTMQLTAGPAGLDMSASLPDTVEARSVHTAVARGDLTGMSFAFSIPPGGDRWSGRTREILKISKIYEVSITPFPAYAETSVEARSALATVINDERTKALIKCNQILLKI
jgi:HK97 family phage prohead protease